MSQKIHKEVARNILLNPGPTTTSMQVKNSLIQPDVCPREKEISNIMIDIKTKLLDIANPNSNIKSSSHEVILLSGSGTGAIESCLSSCVNNKQKILILQNGEYGKRMAEICESLKINYDIINFKITGQVDALALDKYLDEHHSRYAVVAFVHHETTTGIINNLSKINSIIKKYSLVSLVDVMSSFAGIPIDLQKDSIDYLVTSSNKCIHAMAGIGIVIISKTELKRIKEFNTKNFYFNLIKNHQYQKQHNQFLFTPPVQILYALNTALDEHKSQGGVFGRYESYSELYDRLITGMHGLGFKPLVNPCWHSRVLTSFLEPKLSNYSFDSMHDYLKKKGITIYPGKVDTVKSFRIANIGDLTLDDMDYFLNSLNDYIKVLSKR